MFSLYRDQNQFLNLVKFMNFLKETFNHPISVAYEEKCINTNILHAEILAYLISMPIQLIHLRIEQFQWFLDLNKYVSIF